MGDGFRDSISRCFLDVLVWARAIFRASSAVRTPCRYAVDGDVFPGRCGYSQALQVPFADVPEMQARTADLMEAFYQFAVEEVLRDSLGYSVYLSIDSK